MGTQILYQTAVLGVIYLKGDTILNIDQKQTFIFDTWVLCQAFYYAFSDDDTRQTIGYYKEYNQKQSLSVRIGLIILAVLLLAFVNVVAGMYFMRLEQWVASIAIAAMSWPIGWAYSQLAQK